MHQLRGISLYSYLDVASFLGIDGYELLAEARISPADLNQASRLPAAACVALLERSAEKSGCDAFGIHMARCRSFASLGPLSLLLERLDNIDAVITAMRDLRRNLSDILIVSAEAHANVGMALFEVLPPYAEPQTIDLTVALGYIALAGASHGHWAPESVHFAHAKPSEHHVFSSFFSARIEFESSFNGFAFPAHLLAKRLPLADRGMAANARRLLSQVTPPTSLSPATDHVRHSVALLLPQGRATLKEVARNLGQTERALQRRLTAEGNKFIEILNETRRSVARNQLTQSSQSLTDVADRLGYSSLSAFTRWFEKEFETPPSRWREVNRRRN